VPVIGCFDSATLSIGFKVSQLSDYVLNNCGDVWDVAIVHGTGNRTQRIQVGNKEYQITLVERKYKSDNMIQDGKPFIRINDHHVRSVLEMLQRLHCLRNSLQIWKNDTDRKTVRRHGNRSLVRLLFIWKRMMRTAQTIGDLCYCYIHSLDRYGYGRGI
jgi:hypothetical protein